ncbi:hypothetical protein BO79DRAFT_214753 [Aspergillus costaricaensis CBS 115574]|uniref:Uncharacterized protein n=1 Tax=Aspergillus costaricaensis CBS 115574 TaxID=1448317 RepID=A0ACD1INV3_9EURO|nr:hypothetical protein BO79DRAFT_214753 [Aspergillus costaricaensis CBS 115574]RAK91796.1 hypothetical protein BO79DRAFT_214753 [Aspergillus costaricaensis CBS 115574]
MGLCMSLMGRNRRRYPSMGMGGGYGYPPPRPHYGGGGGMPMHSYGRPHGPPGGGFGGRRGGGFGPPGGRGGFGGGGRGRWAGMALRDTRIYEWGSLAGAHWSLELAVWVLNVMDVSKLFRHASCER